MLAAVKTEGLALKCAPGVLKQDKDVVLAAVAADGFALQYASDALKQDKEIVLAAVKTRGLALQYTSGALKQDKDVVLAAVAQFGLALQHASPTLQDDNAVVVVAVAKDGLALVYASYALRRSMPLRALANADKKLLAAELRLRCAVAQLPVQSGGGALTGSKSFSSLPSDIVAVIGTYISLEAVAAGLVHHYQKATCHYNSSGRVSSGPITPNTGSPPCKKQRLVLV